MSRRNRHQYDRLLDSPDSPADDIEPVGDAFSTVDDCPAVDETPPALPPPDYRAELDEQFRLRDSGHPDHDPRRLWELHYLANDQPIPNQNR